MPTHVISGSSGLITNTASLSVPGGLRIARDVVIRRPVHQGIDFGFIQSGGGLIEPRRSYEQFSQFTFPLADSPITGMFEYDNLNATLGAVFYLVGATGNIYRVDSALANTKMGAEPLAIIPNTINWTTSQSQTASSVCYVRSAQMNGNVYFCTKYGVYVFDQVSTAVRPRQAGVGRGLDISQLIQGSGTGSWMANNSSVAYRVVWGYRDPSQNPVYLGPPSGRATFFNTSGFTVNTQLTFPPPNSIVNDIANSGGRTYFYQVYRTAASTVGTGLTSIPDPGDAMTLVYQGSATTSAPVVFTDITPDGFIKGPDLYTNANMEGIQNANYPPPACADIAAFKGVMFYANCAGTTRNSVTRIGTITSSGPIASMTGGGAGPSLITINVSSVFNAPNNEGLVTTNRFTVGGFSVMGLTPTGYPVTVSIAGNTGSSVNGDFFIHAVTASTIVYVAQVTTGVGTGGTYLLEGFGINGGDMVISASRNFTTNSGAGGFNAVAAPATYLNTSPGTPAQNIAIVTQEMAAAFSYLLPRTFTYPPVYVSILGGPTDAPGQIGVEASNPGPLVANSATTTASMTTILCTKSLGSKMIYPDSSAAVVPQQDVSPARLMYSKTFQPEAVPLTSFFDVGDKGAPIRRILATRDNLFIFKDDGVYRLSDDPNVGGKPALYDPTLVLVAPNLATTMDNSIFMLATRGFFKLSNTGAAEFGLQIRDLAVMLVEAQQSFAPCYCIGNERDQIIYWVLPGPSSTVWSLCYSLITQTWTQGNVSDPAPLTWPGIYYKGTLSPAGQLALHPSVILRHSNRDRDNSGANVTHGDLFQEAIIDPNDRSLLNNLSANTGNQLALNCLPPPGDRYYALVTSSIGSVIALTMQNTNVTPAVGDAIWQATPGFNTQYWTITAINGANITVAPYGGSTLAPTAGNSTTFGSVGSVYLMKPLMIDVEWSGFNAGNDAAMKHWKGAAVFFDELCSATDTFNVYSYTEIDQVSQTAAWPSPGVAVHPIYSARILVPMRHQRSRRLHLGFTGGQALKFTVISGFGVESKEHSDTRETE